MTNFLLKLFVKGYKNTQSDSVRQGYGTLSSVVALVLNILLATAKLVVGFLFGLLSVVADGFNNLSDCGNNVISLLVFKLSNKPADKEHPFGHQRMEYVASLVAAFVIITIAMELAIEGVNKILSGAAAPNFHIATIVVLTVSIVLKFWMFLFNRRLSRMISSELLKATSVDSVSDVCATTAVLASILISHFFGINLDGFVGVAVAIFIAVAAIGIFKTTINKILGNPADKKMQNEILSRIKSFEGVLGVHDLMVHSYGENKFYASAHVELSSSLSSIAAHEIIDNIEKDFKLNTNISMLLHLDPVEDNAEADKIRKAIVEVVKGVDEDFSVHGFQSYTNGKKRFVSFDVGIPFDCKTDQNDIKNLIFEGLSSFENTIFEVHVEKTNEE